jgi:hypothetical protein
VRNLMTRGQHSPAGRTETWHRGVRLPWPTAGHRASANNVRRVTSSITITPSKCLDFADFLKSASTDIVVMRLVVAFISPTQKAGDAHIIDRRGVE